MLARLSQKTHEVGLRWRLCSQRSDRSDYGIAAFGQRPRDSLTDEVRMSQNELRKKRAVAGK